MKGETQTRIYISGPMTGKSDLNHVAFSAAERRLTLQGHFAINPHLSIQFGGPKELAQSFAALYRIEDGLHHDIDADDYFKTHDAAKLARAVMDADLAAVRSCDAIYLLRGWEKSRGAKRELKEAIDHGLTVMLEGAE